MFAELYKSEVGWVGGRGLWGEKPLQSVSWVGALARAVRYESATKKFQKKWVIEKMMMYASSMLSFEAVLRGRWWESPLGLACRLEGT